MAENSMPPNAMGTSSYSGGISMASTLIPDFETRDDSEEKTTIDHGRSIRVIRQPPPLTVETEWPSSYIEHPTIVYISIPPMMDRPPSRLQFADRVSSVDTITMSGDEASQDSNDDNEDSNDEDLCTSSSIQYVAPPLAPRNISTGPTRPPPLSFRGSTYGSAISCL